jgi:hypothetical protein
MVEIVDDLQLPVKLPQLYIIVDPLEAFVNIEGSLVVIYHSYVLCSGQCFNQTLPDHLQRVVPKILKDCIAPVYSCHSSSLLPLRLTSKAFMNLLSVLSK